MWTNAQWKKSAKCGDASTASGTPNCPIASRAPRTSIEPPRTAPAAPQTQRRDTVRQSRDERAESSRATHDLENMPTPPRNMPRVAVRK